MRDHLMPARGLLTLLLLAARVLADPATCSIANHSDWEYRDELVRLPAALPTPFDAAKLEVNEDGKAVPHQVEVLEGSPRAVHKGHVWVCVNLKAGERKRYTVRTDAGSTTPPTDRTDAGSATRPTGNAEPRVRLSREGGHYLLDNGLIAVRVPASATSAVGPIAQVRLADGRWAGKSQWNTTLVFNSYSPQIDGDGTLFGKLTLRYLFNDPDYGGPRVPHAYITLTLKPGQRVVHVEEDFDLEPGASWTLDLAEGLRPSFGHLRAWNTGYLKVDESLRRVELKPNRQRLGDALALLQPRWTQGFDQAWFFAASDETQLFGGIAARAGKWVWPHDNLIEVLAPPRDASDWAGLRMPSVRGARYWLLLAGEDALAKDAETIVRRTAMQPLDKLVNEYDLEWPGMPDGGFQGQFFYGSQATNPTSVLRQAGAGLMRQARDQKLKPSRQLLGNFYLYSDPDWYPAYTNGWSPINANFATDFYRVAIASACGLKDHPRFERIRKRAEELLRLDMDNAITLPGGAGQECPGYTAHALGTWLQLAELAKRDLGFDPTQWPRYKAAARFLVRTAPPTSGLQHAGAARQILPMGDTHAPGPDVIELARRFGVEENIAALSSEEFPGFGAVLRSHSGKPGENFLAFKSGPNRGHFHGDQLAFHYIGNGKRLAIDHMCSYAPRADQEHMHNRVSFSSDKFEYANMDGYERLIAFTTSPAIDVAIGQVENRRIRQRPKLPEQVGWAERGPYERFTGSQLVYRRTIALVKQPPGSGDLDYVVIRDEHKGPDLKATYNLHVESAKLERSGNIVNFGDLTLAVIEPKNPAFERFDWSFTKEKTGYTEKTVGARFTARGSKTRFVTVLYPSGSPPKLEAIAGGVRVTFTAGRVDEVTFAEDSEQKDTAVVTLRRDGSSQIALRQRDINLHRSQGDIGLFVPASGYDFGEIPEWLIKQRAGKLIAQ